MSVSIEPISANFAASVQGIDLTQPVSSADVAAIHGGMAHFAVLAFPDQRISDEQQLAFTKHLGAIENARGGHIRKDGEERLGSGMIDVSNLEQHGRPYDLDDRRRIFNLGNRLWHSDSSYRAIPASYSLLSGRTVATRGGETEFADMRAAYDALDKEMKECVEHLICEHFLAVFARFNGIQRIYRRGTRHVPPSAPAARSNAPGHRV